MKKVFSSVVLTLLISFSAQALEWKSVFISGDDSIPNFDKGRKDVAAMLAPLGAYEENQIHLSSALKEVKGKVLLANGNNVVNTFKTLKINKATDGCFVFMTSHGAHDEGFYMSRAGILDPATFAKLLDIKCGDVPTVVLISACYSGQFITPAIAKSNRVILTAAIKDRPSFGCSADTDYTFWDECLLENIPTSNTWKEVYAGVKQCIESKEALLGFDPSKPQAFFGANVQNLTILNK